MRIKTVNALMKYLREQKGIAIKGSAQKQKLRAIGYYHGYKGYRFFHQSKNPLAYTNFDQLLSVYNFDMQLKSLLYSPLMQIETALKNYALEEILTECNSDRFVDVFSSVLNHHCDIVPRASKSFKEQIARELNLRSRIYNTLNNGYTKKPIIQHFYNQDRSVPIWAIFETISLGDFGNLLGCVNNKVAMKIANSVGLNQAFNGDLVLMQKIVYTLKDLRNAVAHNDPVFDVRFKSSEIYKRIPKMLVKETAIQNISFATIADYIILIAWLMHRLDFPKTEIRRLINSFVACYEELRKQIPPSLFATIIHTDTRPKMRQLLLWI